MDEPWSVRTDTRKGDKAHGITFVMYERRGRTVRAEAAVSKRKLHVDGIASLTLALGQWKYGDELIAQMFTQNPHQTYDRQADGWTRVQIYFGPAGENTAVALEGLAAEIRKHLNLLKGFEMLTPEQSLRMKAELENASNAVVDRYTSASSPAPSPTPPPTPGPSPSPGPTPPPAGSPPIIPMKWPLADGPYVRSSVRQYACQFRFTVDPAEAPRPGSLNVSPAGPAGGNTQFSYKWSKQPMADADGGVLGGSARFSVSQPNPTQPNLPVIHPGETWYVSFKMTGGNTEQKFIGDLVVNAKY